MAAERLGPLCKTVASPEDPLAQFLENWVIFNRGPAPRKPGWVGYEGLPPRGPEWGQDPEQEGDGCSAALCGRLE